MQKNSQKLLRSFRYFQLSTVSPQKTEMETNGNWAFDWLDLSKDSTKSNYDQITYKLGSVATWIHRLCDMTKKVTSGKLKRAERHRRLLFCVSTTRALLHFSDQNRQRVFFQSLDVAHRSIVNGVTFADRYELLCIIIEHEQVYHLSFRTKNRLKWDFFE